MLLYSCGSGGDIVKVYVQANKHLTNIYMLVLIVTLLTHFNHICGTHLYSD